MESKQSILGRYYNRFEICFKQSYQLHNNSSYHLIFFLKIVCFCNIIKFWKHICVSTRRWKEKMHCVQGCCLKKAIVELYRFNKCRQMNRIMLLEMGQLIFYLVEPWLNNRISFSCQVSFSLTQCKIFWPPPHQPPLSTKHCIF